VPAMLLLSLFALSLTNPQVSLFDENHLLEAQLTGPLKTLLKHRKDRQELPFVLKVAGIEHAVKIRTRGKSRLRVCSFPPLRIRFSPADTEQTLFASQDKLKLVTHCQRGDAAQTNVLEEFAAYRIYSFLSPLSYQVRLVHLTYTDTAARRGKEPVAHYGFLIESQDSLTRRVGGTLAKVKGVSLASFDKDQLALMYIFQYLIGNTDWSMVADEEDSCCHNGDLVDIGKKRFYVPYDFDLAGLVNAKYAYPDPVLRIRKVTQRLYRGFCMPTDVLRKALFRIDAVKAIIFQEMAELPGISPRGARHGIDFLNRFFTLAEDHEGLLHTFERHCISPH
jgi:hypothetical protein